ncbi:P-loop containing nucleoside triphosphate hydrolase protein, partial [Blyttiomyces helicus]
RSSKTQIILQIIGKELIAGKKFVIVSQWTMYLDILMAAFKLSFPGISYTQLDGRTLPVVHQKMVDNFQNSTEEHVIYASLSSSDQGITLKWASTMIIADLFWNKATMDQMADRIHRIGQQRNVSIHSIITKDTIEVKIRQL